ncbi:hypothetical protein DM01DRAFT_1404316 [Hesseltinella vesiculosa]|uniref:Uncharacterized protein n=1 Tax=Hesseltinella vesiculosa TaxID=101127 RepID=A0A1X2GU27_9FUNG|nr:hypothetical protein DM01DRAFT_1404316 [Hesseltinella vesiculosa]
MLLIYYAVQKRAICRSLGSIIVRPACKNGQPVTYNFYGLQATLDDRTFCKCSLPPQDAALPPQEVALPLKDALPPQGLAHTTRENSCTTHLKRAREQLDLQIDAKRYELLQLRKKRKALNRLLNEFN